MYRKAVTVAQFDQDQVEPQADAALRKRQSVLFTQPPLKVPTASVKGEAEALQSSLGSAKE